MRAAAARARSDAKETVATTPAFDPLAASVRNRARNRRVAAEAAATSATTTAESPAKPVAGADARAMPAPAAMESTRSNEDAPSAARDISTPIGTPAAPVADAPRAESAPPLVPSPTEVASARTPVTEAPPPAAEAQPTPAPDVPFVERRRNPDVPIPPGVVPAHPLRRRTDAPSFARAQAAASAHRSGWRWPAAVAALSLLLALQLVLAQRDTLAADARWRPTVSALCTLLRCQLPPWREPGAFTMLSRDVRAHPSAPGALLINASFRNDARWPQPWPRVLLTLSNADGRIVGARAFAAGEYLGADTAATQHELAPGQTAAITLAVVEPAPDIVAFSFDFR